MTDLVALIKQTLEAAKVPQLPKEVLGSLHAAFYAELQTRVGERIYKVLTEAQRTEFETIHHSGEESEGIAWLKREVPSHQTTVLECVDELLAELEERIEDWRWLI